MPLPAFLVCDISYQCIFVFTIDSALDTMDLIKNR